MQAGGAQSNPDLLRSSQPFPLRVAPDGSQPHRSDLSDQHPGRLLCLLRWGFPHCGQNCRTWILLFLGQSGTDGGSTHFSTDWLSDWLILDRSLYCWTQSLRSPSASGHIRSDFLLGLIPGSKKKLSVPPCFNISGHFHAGDLKQPPARPHRRRREARQWRQSVGPGRGQLPWEEEAEGDLLIVILTNLTNLNKSCFVRSEVNRW